MTIILTLDVGNSRAKFGLFRVAAQKSPQPLAVTAVRLAANINLAAALVQWLPTLPPPQSCTVSGSNLSVRDVLLDAWPLGAIPVRLVDHHTQVPLAVDLDAPDKVGIDRLLTGLAARRLVSHGQAVIVVDSGTATTVNLVTADDTFRGGAILPGLRLSAHALHDYTDRLPLIDTEQLGGEASIVDAPLLGRDTESAMKAGLFWGQLGAVRELTDRLAQVSTTEFGAANPPSIVMTGGGGRQLVDHFPRATYIDSLTLHGLAMLSPHEP